MGKKLDKLAQQALSHLEPDERILTGVLGAYETKVLGQDSVRNGALFVTNRRGFFYAKKLGGYDFEEFPHSNISSIEGGKNFMGPHITVFASGNKAHMKWIKDGDFQAFVQEVRNQMQASKQTSRPPNEQPDIAGQIKKLAELKEMGLLSDEEFQSKKSELLSRM